MTAPIQSAAGRRGVRDAVRLARQALGLAWSAGRREVLVASSAQLAIGLSTVVQLLIARALLDSVLDLDRGGSLGDVVLPVILLGVTLAISGIGGVVQGESATLLADLVTREATDRILDVTSTVPLARFEDPTFHDELERARTNAISRPGQAVNGVLTAFAGAVTVAGVAVAIVVIAPELVPLLLLSVVPLWAATTIIGRSNHRVQMELTTVDRLRRYLSNVLGSADLAKDVRSYQLAGELRRRHDVLWDDRIRILREHRWRRLLVGIVGTVLSTTVTVGVLAAVLWLLDEGRVSLADAGTTILAVIAVGQRSRGIVGGVGQLYESSLFFEDVDAFVCRNQGTPSTGTVPVTGHRVALRDVHFRYEGAPRDVLHGIDLHVDEGEIVALVGENGSGKTTIAKLIAGLYEPTAGSVTIGGVPTTEADPDQHRDRIGVLFQDFAKLWLSIRDNVGFGRIERLDDDAGIRDAVHGAGAAPFVEALPGAYETLLSRFFEGGTQLSGGQWQRLALARALFRDAGLLIMDEPTAALDPRAEHDLYQRMRTMFAGHSVVLISHRFSSVRDADRIYVLADGRIVEVGDHDRLMAAGGLYAELYDLQAAAYRTPDGPPIERSPTETA